MLARLTPRTSVSIPLIISNSITLMLPRIELSNVSTKLSS